MTESWESKLSKIRKKKDEDKDAQADAQQIESELPEIRDRGNVAIMTPTRPRKGDGES